MNWQEISKRQVGLVAQGQVVGGDGEEDGQARLLQLQPLAHFLFAFGEGQGQIFEQGAFAGAGVAEDDEAAALMQRSVQIDSTLLKRWEVFVSNPLRDSALRFLLILFPYF